MISRKDIYDILGAIIPMYFALTIAYSSVRWWRIFTPEQCGGINRFLRVFAIPLLCFKVISSNNLYAMNYKLFAADSLQKTLTLAALIIWKSLSKKSSLEWMITLFALSSLPNTLIMGLPIARAMYGVQSASLMVQTMVFQSIIWVNVLLILFEYRAAKLSISEKFRNHAAASSVVSFRADGGVPPHKGFFEPLQDDAGEISGDDDGKVRLEVLEKPTEESTTPPRASTLSEVEIYSVRSSAEPSSRDSDLNGFSHTFPENKGATGGGRDLIFSVNSSEKTTPTLSFDFDDETTTNKHKLHMFVWNSSTPSSSTSAITDENPQTQQEHATHFGVMFDSSKDAGSPSSDTCSTAAMDEGENAEKKMEMPPARRMMGFILYMVGKKFIRNPNTYSSLLGVAWSLLSFKYHIKMPTVLDRCLSMISDTCLALAMFSLGTFMAAQPNIIACSIWEAASAMVARFLVSPAVVATTAKLVGLHGIALRTAIIQAAFPQANMSFVFAKEYNVNANVISTSVVIGMLIALPVVLLYYLLLGAI